MEIRRLFDPLVKRFRHKIRYYLRPRSIDEAEEIREIFSRIYMISAVGVFVAASVFTFRNNIDFGEPSPESIAKRMNIKNPITVKRYKGFTKVEEYEIDPNNPKTTKVETE